MLSFGEVSAGPRWLSAKRNDFFGLYSESVELSYSREYRLFLWYLESDAGELVVFNAGASSIFLGFGTASILKVPASGVYAYGDGARLAEVWA